MISATFPYQKRTRPILGQTMAYVDVGVGDPIVFLHGNPTSSYIWRNILPQAWLARSEVPKLYIKADPAMLQPSQDAFCRSWPAQSQVIVRGLHTPQEDSPDQIGQAVASWLKTLA